MIGDDECMFGHKAADVNMDIIICRDDVKGTRLSPNVTVSDNTDVFVLLVHLHWKLRPLAEITKKWFDGKTIDINATAMALGDKCIQRLPIHAITGCDSVSYPFGKTRCPH